MLACGAPIITGWREVEDLSASSRMPQQHMTCFTRKPPNVASTVALVVVRILGHVWHPFRAMFCSRSAVLSTKMLEKGNDLNLQVIHTPYTRIRRNFEPLRRLRTD